MIGFNIIVPILALVLDAMVYNKLTKSKSETEGGISNDFLKLIAKRKDLPFETIIYQRYQFAFYSKFEMKKCCSLFDLYSRYLHPLGSLFMRFDYEIKRLARFIIISIQYSLIAIICGIVFSN